MQQPIIYRNKCLVWGEDASPSPHKCSCHRRLLVQKELGMEAGILSWASEGKFNIHLPLSDRDWEGTLKEKSLRAVWLWWVGSVVSRYPMCTTSGLAGLQLSDWKLSNRFTAWDFLCSPEWCWMPCSCVCMLSARVERQCSSSVCAALCHCCLPLYLMLPPPLCQW